MPSKSPEALERRRARMRAYTKGHYQANKETYKAHNRARRKRTVTWLAELKTGPCTDCGVPYNPWQMDWDHVRGEKLFDVATANKGIGRAAVLAEIAKCELVCANCHRQRTYERAMGLR